MRTRVYKEVVAVAAGLCLSLLSAIAPVQAQDKSASSVVALPTPGGTVQSESGTFELSSNTGSARFNLPLPPLPLRAGLAPGISLGYDQFAGDSGSGFGIGWSLSLPAISMNDDRGSAIGGFREGGDFFNRLSLGGQRLTFVGKSADGNQLFYRPQFSESYVTIVYHHLPVTVTTLGAEGESLQTTLSSGFVVTLPDGMKQYFSGDADVAEGNFASDSPYVTRWPLVLQTNPVGDAIHYEYEKHGNRHYLTEVRFAGGKSRYQFELTDTHSSLVNHMGGFRRVNQKLYTRVVARFDDDVHSQWCFAYIGRSSENNGEFAVRAHPQCLDKATADLTPLIDKQSINVLDQLRVIYRFGNTQGEALGEDTLRMPDIDLRYSSWTASDLATRDLVYEPGALEWTNDLNPRHFELADINMDSLVDIVQSDATQSRVHFGTGSLEDSYHESLPFALSRTSASGASIDVNPQLADDRFHFADIFGDSYVDLLEIEQDILHIYDGNAQGDYAYFGRQIALPGIAPESFTGGRGRFMDVNQDGLSDIITTQLNANGNSEWVIFLNLTTRLANGDYRVNFGKLVRPFPVKDLDPTPPLTRSQYRLVDVNGDKLPDLAAIQVARKGFCIYENQGNLFSSSATALLFGDATQQDAVCGVGKFVPVAGMLDSDNLDAMWYVDVNGDGIVDFASMGAQSDQLRVWLGFGDGSFLESPLELALNLRVQVGANPQSSRTRVSDLDGDGQAEILIVQKPSGADVRPVVAIDFNRSDTQELIKANLLTTVEFSSGMRHDVRYATSTDELIRDKRNGLPTTALHFPVVVAKQMISSEGAAGIARDRVRVIEQAYHQPFFDILNRKFVGFSSVEQVVHGDEFTEQGETTQKASYSHEHFHTLSSDVASLHLAGKLKVRKTYALDPDAEYLAVARASNTLDPDDVMLHSLSTQTRTRDNPSAGRLLSCSAAQWSAVSLSPDVHYIRKLSEAQTGVASDAQQQGTDDQQCLQPTSVIAYSDFDEFNLPAKTSTSVRAIAAPQDILIPAINSESVVDYTQARADLASLNIVNLPSRQTRHFDDEFMSKTDYAYHVASGKLREQRTQTQSRLGEVPDALEQFVQQTHTVVRKLEYDLYGNTTAVADALGVTEVVAYDGNGIFPIRYALKHGEDDRLDQVTLMGYEGARKGMLASSTTPVGMTTSHEYDALGRRIREARADGAETRYQYHLGRDNNPTLIMTSTRRYPDAASVPEGESEWVHFLAAYNADGTELANVENVDGGGVRVLSYKIENRNNNTIFEWTPYIPEHDQALQSTSVETVFAAGVIPEPEDQLGTRIGYDELGRVALELQPSGRKVTHQYHQWGVQTNTTYNDTFGGLRTQIHQSIGNNFGFVGNAISNPAGETHLTRATRDAFGHLKSITLPGESTAREFVHNTAGLLEMQSIPGIGNIFQFYDERLRLVARARVSTSGRIAVEETRYDFLNRKVTTLVDGSVALQHQYDVNADQLGSQAAFGDAVGQPLGMLTESATADPNGILNSTQRFTYDANLRMLHTEVALGDQIFAESYQYTLDGEVNRIRNPFELEGLYALSPNKNLKSVSIKHPSFSDWEAVIENVTYNPKGRLARIDYRKGVFTELGYDPDTLFLNRIDSRFQQDGVAQPLQAMTLELNGSGSIARISDTLSETNFGHVNRSALFHYDWKNQLVRSERYNETLSYSYTQAGSFVRNDEYAPGVELVLPESAVTGLIPVSTDDQPYTFNDFGELLSNPTIEATRFDAFGHLVFARTKEHDVFFGYDHQGARKYKQIVSRAEPNDKDLYLYPLDSVQIGPKGRESHLFVKNSRLVRMEHATGKWYYYLKDHLESSDYVMNQNGVPVEQMLYKPYGTEHQADEFSPAWKLHTAEHAEQLPVEKTHHRFTGQYLDDVTGLYYFKARYYDPKLGRFISPDPLFINEPNRCITDPVQCNLYSYSVNNPVLFKDTDGNDAKVTINGGDITVSTTIYIYGSGASRATANLFQESINNEWNAVNTYTHAGSGKTFNVNFDVSVELLDPDDPTNVPFVIPGASNPFSTDNYIEVDRNATRSFVRGGDEGVWRGAGRGGKSLADDNPAAHEAGHLIGLDDRYSDGSGANPGWEGNIMGEGAGQGVVEQRNIDAVLDNSLEDYDGEDNYETTIDEDSPSW